MTAFGLGVLKLAPSDFWGATPAELAAAARGASGMAAPVGPLRRGGLERLMARYPDLEESDHGG